MRFRMFLAILVVAALAACAHAPGGQRFILMSSTIGPIDAGIVPLLEEKFEIDTGIRARHVGAGTGAALEIAKQGTVDLVLVHAKALEEQFVKDGFGTTRIPLMYNDFVIVGPAADPAGIKGMPAALAFQTLAAKQAPFVSRGDKSGTHIAEMDVWAKAGIKPAGSWYEVYAKGAEGNGPTLRYTDGKGAYTLMDRATVVTLRDQVKLAVLVEGDQVLLNFISLIPVNPKKFPNVNHEAALAFADWLTNPASGQRIIESFGKEKYGQPLFFPNSDQWRAAHPAGK